LVRPGYALVVWSSFWRAGLILALTTLAFFFFYKMSVAREFLVGPTVRSRDSARSAIFAAATIFALFWMVRRSPRNA
jgi:hypothetical protein